jgi:hypothetical protein
MGKVSDIKIGLDFESAPSHVIDYDPSVETRTVKGREGDFDVIAVKENGVSFDLSLSNKSLIRELQKLTSPTRIKVTRTGKSYDTKYTVERVK